MNLNHYLGTRQLGMPQPVCMVEWLSSTSDCHGLQAKFLQDGAGVMSYSGLSTFFRGLEGKIGAPDPNVLSAMRSEHTERGDCGEPFTTPNYEVRFR